MRVKIKTIGLLRNEGWYYNDNKELKHDYLPGLMLIGMQKMSGEEFDAETFSNTSYLVNDGYVFKDSMVIILD